MTSIMFKNRKAPGFNTAAALGLGALIAVAVGCSDGRIPHEASGNAEGATEALTPGGPVPLSVAHGVVLYSDGTTKNPTPEVVREAQAYLVNRLASEATPETRARLDREVPGAAKTAALRGLQPAGEVDVRQMEQDAEVLDWLVDSVDTPNAAVVKQMSIFLKNQIARAKPPAPGKVASQSFAIETGNGGTAYANACASAGVPTPPAWRSSAWVFRGTLTGDTNFLGGSQLADVYTFTSTSPAGICIALPRRATSTSTSYSVVGVICQGTDTSRACFYDNRAGQTVFTNETSLAIPGTKFVGGADLAPNGQGVCTDCHAGENAFIIHPGTALDVAGVIAKNWIRPFAPTGWPQNIAPGSELSSAGEPCSGCHNKASGRRFPRMEDLSGWCAIANTATGRTMPVSPPHEAMLANKCAPRARATRLASTKTKWHDSFGDDSELLMVGDFDGNGRTDLLAFTLAAGAEAWVALSNGSSGFTPTGRWHAEFGHPGQQLNVGDFNGDGMDDIIAASMNSAGTVTVATSNGSSFNAASVWNGHVLSGEVYRTGDFNGDRRDDLVVFTKGTTNDALVQLSNGSSFGGSAVWNGSISPGSQVPLVGDFNADGYDDIVSFTLGSTNDALVSLSTGRAFPAPVKWHESFGSTGEIQRVADMNGDGRDDIVSFSLSSRHMFVSLSTGTAFGPFTTWHSSFATTGQLPFVGDVNADHRADGILFSKGTAADVFVSLATP